MFTSVLGAPGSGKTTVTALLKDRLPDHVVIDWDAFMAPANELAGCDIAVTRATWPAYSRLVRILVDAVLPAPIVLLGVCTPHELDGWPIDAWLLLDCDDDERRKRLAPNLKAGAVEDAITDARRYRALGLSSIETTSRTPEAVAEALADRVRRITS